MDEAAKLKASENDSETGMQIDLCYDCDSKEMEEQMTYDLDDSCCVLRLEAVM